MERPEPSMRASNSEDAPRSYTADDAHRRVDSPIAANICVHKSVSMAIQALPALFAPSVMAKIWGVALRGLSKVSRTHIYCLFKSNEVPADAAQFDA